MFTSLSILCDYFSYIFFVSFAALQYWISVVILCVFVIVYTSCIVLCMYLDPMEEQQCRNDKAEYGPSSRFYIIYGNKYYTILYYTFIIKSSS